MKVFNKFAAQGEVHIRKIDKLPDGLTAYKAENGKYVIGHSETGHSHDLLTMDRAQVFQSTKAPEGMTILYAILDAPNELVHNREFYTHETISFEPGIYEFRLGREFDHYEALARKQAD